MTTSAVFIALIGTLQCKAAISAAISYEPIKITVNENFNAQPGQVSTEFQSLEPGVVHQGANFYFKPRFNLPSSSITHHIEALMSLIQQHHSCTKGATKVVFEKDKQMEILMPLLYPKEALSDTIMEEEINSEIVVPVPISITEESIPAIPELEVIPEAPVLPPPSFNGIPPIVEEEVKKEKSVILEESTIVLNEVPPKPARLELVIITEAPVLPPLSANDIQIVEEIKVEEPITLTRPEPIVVDVESKSATPNLLIIPEAPMLPALSYNGIPSIVEEEVKKEESVILEELTDIFPTKPAITVGLITEPNITYVEPKPNTSGLLDIPEAPVLPSLSFNDMLSFVKKEVKKEASIILEESRGESQEATIIEVEPKPATPELLINPEAPILPTLSANDIRSEKVNIEEPITLSMPKPIFVDFEPKPKISEVVVIPEAPVLPPLSFNDLPSFIEEKLKKKESIILEQQTGVFPKIPKITVGPITEPIINYVEPKPKTSELLVISETPLLPPFSANGIHIVKEVKIEEPISWPTLESVVIDIEPKRVTPELLVIPEAPMLPPLSFNGIPSVVEAEVKKEESVILEESTGVLPPMSEMPVVEEVKSDESILLEESTGSIPEISARPTLETFVETETTEEIEIPILLEESIELIPPIAEISSGPTLQEPEITNFYVLEEVSQPNSDRVATVKETLPPTIIRKPSNNLGVFSYAPFLSHLSNRAPKTKKRMFPKPASLERFMLKKHPFKLPVKKFPRLSLNDMESLILGNQNQFLYPTSYTHDVVEKRIAPNMAFKKNAPPKRVKNYLQR